ncbi:MAG: hypothetical protein JSW27_17040 [Phycisphaerales bacterium]|nr:MAG: hypothetical protein JSW27_17040 [Phycisphaerales bacterium]
MRQRLAIALCLCLTGTSWAAQPIIYVDAAATGGNEGSSWTGAYVHLQDALSEAERAAKPIEIRLAQGVYAPIDRHTPFELVDGISLKGSYAGITAGDPEARDPKRYRSVLNGDLNDDDETGSWLRLDDSLQIVICSETDATVTIEGFTLAGAARMGISIENGSAPRGTSLSQRDQDCRMGGRYAVPRRRRSNQSGRSDSGKDC